MWYLRGSRFPEHIAWQLSRDNSWRTEEEGICLSFWFSSTDAPTRREAIRTVAQMVRQDSLDWIQPRLDRWIIDVDLMRQFVRSLPSHAGHPAYRWLKGKVALNPDFEVNPTDFGGYGVRHQILGVTVQFFITEEAVTAVANPDYSAPDGIRSSLEEFRFDHPDPTKTAFLMIRFGDTPAHAAITQGITAVLGAAGIAVVRADGKQYHDDLFPNVQTYMHGCGFGIAVFERLSDDDFNPNVSLEVGYMFALRKPVCLLKDQTLRTLHTDLVGKLYGTFDPQKALKSIQQPVRQWALDKGLIPTI